mmetsp:Transcript_95228/g.188688  ORF Transcript_95228/g.188688 Transcript_95228/m.188688 type:complete len:573 (+) Transcript_95228:31-1749(+)
MADSEDGKVGHATDQTFQNTVPHDYTFRELPFRGNALEFIQFSVTADRLEFEFRLVEAGGRICYTLRPALQLSDLTQLLSQLSDRQWVAAEQMMLAIGMAVMAYVWLGFLTPLLVVRVGQPRMTTDQAAFWRHTILENAREHLFVNGISSLDGTSSLDESLRLVCEPEPRPSYSAHTLEAKLRGQPTLRTPQSLKKDDVRVLVPMGAGKDSMVVWELLGQVPGGCDRQWFVLEGEAHEFSRCWRYRALAEASGTRASDVLIARFDWPFAEFEECCHSKLSISSHPWACLVCFVATLVALLHSCNHVAVGNTRSASLGSGIAWGGAELHHQWDKTWEFECMANDYLNTHCSGQVCYFSALGPLWAVQVGLLFRHFCGQYLPLIISCSTPMGSDGSRWCASCAKCAFAAAVLGAFFPVTAVRAVFGDDLFQTSMGIAQLDVLAGLSHDAAAEDGVRCVVADNVLPSKLTARIPKPLECVGDPSETRVALGLVRRRYALESLPVPRLFTAARCAALQLRTDSGMTGLPQMLRDWNEDRFVPDWFSGVAYNGLQDALSSLEVEFGFIPGWLAFRWL